MAAIPIERDAFAGPGPIEILARVAARIGESDRAIAALQKLLSMQTTARPLLTCRSLPRSFGSIRCSIHSGMIRASKNSSLRSRRKRDRIPTRKMSAEVKKEIELELASIARRRGNSVRASHRSRSCRPNRRGERGSYSRASARLSHKVTARASWNSILLPG